MRKRLIAGLIMSCAMYISLLANGEHEHSETYTSAPTLDSAYAEIRVGYERLKPIFEAGCFDCHSEQTDFPWYHALPFVGPWMDGHVTEARDELDFTPGFPFGGHHKRQADNLHRIKHELQENAMPLRSYRIMHWGAAPNAEEKDSIYAWADRGLILLAAHGEYPFNEPENVPGQSVGEKSGN